MQTNLVGSQDQQPTPMILQFPFALVKRTANRRVYVVAENSHSPSRFTWRGCTHSVSVSQRMYMQWDMSYVTRLSFTQGEGLSYGKNQSTSIPSSPSRSIHSGYKISELCS